MRHSHLPRQRLGVFRLAAGAAATLAFVLVACQSHEMQEGLAPSVQSGDLPDSSIAVPGDSVAGAAVVIGGLTISPTSATLAPGAQMKFTPLGWMPQGGDPIIASVTWSATGGTINSSGVYTAGNTPGTYTVTAKSTTTPHIENIKVTISGTAAAVQSLTISPSSATLAVRATKSFTATAKLTNGTTQTKPAVTWTATGGTISSTGLYTAGSNPGTFRVIGSSTNGKKDTSTVKITPLDTVRITLSPESASLTPGQTKQFSVTAGLNNGTSISNPTVSWRATGGTISSGGLYTAGNTGGTYKVIASQVGGGVADTATVTITASSQTPPPAGGGNYPHRPSNYGRVVAEFSGSCSVPHGSSYEYMIPGCSPWSIVGNADVSQQSDASAPASGPLVWRVFERAGTYGGGVPGQGSSSDFGRWGLPINAPAIYASVWVKWSPGFKFHPVSQKFLRMDMAGASQAFLVQASHNGHFLRASDENLGIAYEPQNGALPSTGVWHQVEVLIVRGNPGSIKVWVDGQLRTDRTGPLATSGNFTTFEIHSTMGGGGIVLPADQWFTVDHIFVAAP